MKLIVGLGNPGEKYQLTRHNVGWLVLDQLKQEIINSEFINSTQIPNSNFQFSKKANAEYFSFKIGDETIELIKPQTFMNKSGYSVSYAKNKHKVSNDNIYIIHDDLDINLGDYKIAKGKGPREHNGLLDIYEKLGTKDFWHIRVGIENRQRTENGKRNTDNFIKGEDYVLMNFTEEEMVIVEKVIDEVSDRLIELMDDSK